MSCLVSPLLRQGGRRDLPASHHGSVKARKGVSAYQDIVPRATARVPPQGPDTRCGVADGAHGPPPGSTCSLVRAPQSGAHTYSHVHTLRGNLPLRAALVQYAGPVITCVICRYRECRANAADSSAHDPQVAGPRTTLPHKHAPAAWIPMCALFSGATAPLTQRSQRRTHGGT